MTEQDQPGRGALGVELPEERVQQLGRLGIVHVARIVGPIAVVATAPIEEHLHARLTAVLRQRDHVGIVDRADVDALARGDVRERLEAVADAGGHLEFEACRRVRHRRLELILDGIAAPGQELPRLLEQLPVLGRADPPDARRRAPLDLVLQAGPRAVVEDAVGAGAQRKGAQQRRERLVDRAGRRERPEIVAVLALRPAMPADARKRLLLGGLADVDVGERLVVAQDDVERRPVPLDHVALEQQRLDVARRGHHLEPMRQRHHALQPGAQRRRFGVRGQPLLQGFGLADVQDLALGIEHAVDAGPVRQGRHMAVDQRGAARPVRRAGRTILVSSLAALRPDGILPLLRSIHRLSALLVPKWRELAAPSTLRARHGTGTTPPITHASALNSAAPSAAPKRPLARTRNLEDCASAPIGLRTRSDRIGSCAPERIMRYTDDPLAAIDGGWPAGLGCAHVVIWAGRLAGHVKQAAKRSGRARPGRGRGDFVLEARQ